MSKKVIEKYRKDHPKVPSYLFDKVEQACAKRSKLTEKVVKQILDKVVEEYNNSLVVPFESIGVITAQSVGEPATQMTLNTFHNAGIEGMKLSSGFPRFVEILDTKKNMEAPMMVIYLKDTKDKEKAVSFTRRIKEARFKEIVKNCELDLEHKKVIFELNMKIIEDRKIILDKIVGSLDKLIKKSAALEEGILTISLPKNAIFKELDSCKELALNSRISGVKDVKDAMISFEEDEYVIRTLGTSLSDVLKMEEVDTTRTYSNNIFEIQKLFGIEAVRQLILLEFEKILEDQGLEINVRHLMLLADFLTYTGDVKGINRFGIISEKRNVLTRVAFETPLKYLAQACMAGDENNVDGITDNIMMNQLTRVGTGYPKIRVKQK